MPGTRHLFSIAHGLLRTATLVSLFLIATLVLCLGWTALAALSLVPPMIPQDAMPGIPMSQILAATTFTLVIATICIALVTGMFLLTARIIDTASHGDPFVTKNAARLNQIGLLLLAVQAMGLFFDLVMKVFPDKLSKSQSVYFDVSASGVLAALLIFVLAQIFRRGSEMRAELEGTV
ncbi:MAG TPA: DUF2975 domain-containing protein [Rhizomicrobium sp.]|nr:DUF2975 domain-containing protein [Rhizomicrobium sp.]